MTKFESLMDDMKSSLLLCQQNKKVFLPPILGQLIIGLIGIIIAIIAVFAITAGSIGLYMFDGFNIAIVLLIIVASLFIALLFVSLSLIVEVGVITLLRDLLNGLPMSMTSFWQGIKTYALRAIGTSILFFIIMIFVYALALIPVILYTITVGLLTGGWAIILLSASIQALIGYWLLIMIDTDMGGFSSIGENLRFGKSHFKIMLLIFIIQTLLTANLPSYFGFLGLIFSFAITAVITTYFKLILLTTYRRYTNETENDLY